MRGSTVPAQKHLIIERKCGVRGSSPESTDDGWVWSPCEAKESSKKERQVFSGMQCEDQLRIVLDRLQQGKAARQAGSIEHQSRRSQYERLAEQIMRQPAQENTIIVCWGGANTSKHTSLYGEPDCRESTDSGLIRALMDQLRKQQVVHVGLRLTQVPVFSQLTPTVATSNSIRHNSSKSNSRKSENLLLEFDSLGEGGSITQALSNLANITVEQNNNGQRKCHLLTDVLGHTNSGSLRIVRIVDLVDPLALQNSFPLEYGVLYYNELDELARILSGLPSSSTPSELLSLVKQPSSNLNLCCWLVEGEEPEQSGALDFMEKVKPRRQRRNESLALTHRNELIGFHKSEIQLKRKQIERLQKQVVQLEDSISGLWSHQIRNHDNHFLEHERAQILGVIDRATDLRTIDALSKEIQLKGEEAAHLQQQLSDIRDSLDTRSRRLQEASKEHSLQYFQLLATINKPKEPSSITSKPNQLGDSQYQYSSSIRYVTHHPSEKARRKEKLQEQQFLKMRKLDRQLAVKRQQLLQELAQDKQIQLAAMKAEKQTYQRTVKVAADKLKQLLHQHTLKVCTPAERSELALLEQQIKLNRLAKAGRSRPQTAKSRLP